MCLRSRTPYTGAEAEGRGLRTPLAHPNQKRSESSHPLNVKMWRNHLLITHTYITWITKKYRVKCDIIFGVENEQQKGRSNVSTVMKIGPGQSSQNCCWR